MTDRAAPSLFAILVVGLALGGCGGSGAGAKTSPTASRSSPASANATSGPISRPWPTQAAAPAIAACKRAVARAVSLSASSRHEIAEPCDSMDERVKENKALVHTVCQELASATSLSPSAPSTKHVAAACYAEYAQTLKGSLPGDR